MSTPADPPFDHAARLIEELHEQCAAAQLEPHAEELLIEGYASALALESARRRMRAEALELAERELGLAARERELRALLRTLRGQIAGAAGAIDSDDETAPQRLH